ncbi:MAG: NAD(P)/FAD-dependent oxidoreductase [Acidimicrobiales bacterium]|nr:NAD(P)/FAD-dependent oxidoreductase [Acidimicrobiales bacterium]
MEHFDVLVVGAGLSGVGAAYRLQSSLPTKSYAIVEARPAIGGTWDLFRFPGIRSDSDMFTLGYPFRPWRQTQSVADGASIRRYIHETAAEYGIDRQVRHGQKVVRASWSTAASEWAVETETGQSYRCGFLFVCAGYFDYERGHEPELPGRERFRGPVIHPQRWPDDLDYTGKTIVIIGSGATAVTLVPAMAERAGHVTMLQRSPSYVVSLPGVDPVARLLDRYLPARAAHRANRFKSIVVTQAFYQYCRRFPDSARRFLHKTTAAQLPEGYPVDPDFTPGYDPWDQRMCIAPDGDLFKAIRSGRASVETGRIETFTETGIRLESGRELEADIVVTATGLQLLPAGGIDLAVDGNPVRLSDTWLYRGCLLSGLPNFAVSVGYTNASWTLKSDLTASYVCRLLAHMDRHGYAMAVPNRPPGGGTRPLLDLSSGYVQRAAAFMPKQGERKPWRIRQNYLLDYFSARFSDVREEMTFHRAADLAALVRGPQGRGLRLMREY